MTYRIFRTDKSIGSQAFYRFSWACVICHCCGFWDSEVDCFTRQGCSGMISANNSSLTWNTKFQFWQKLMMYGLMRPYLSIGSRKNVQKSFFSWFKIKNGTPKFLCCLVNHNFVKLHFRDAQKILYEQMWWQKLYANKALLSPCHLIINFLLKNASDSHQVQRLVIYCRNSDSIHIQHKSDSRFRPLTNEFAM